ncbi:leucyl aminopeptidase family protein [Candidatus Jorgensenbacteria bacterium]|nr:leucyl aminopeptidase family protein [Candidatus Jorgensenbacteria bacterium]
MKIKVTQKLLPYFTPVLVIKEGESIERHSLFQKLPLTDKHHLKAFVKHASIRSDANHVVFLPSGVAALVLGVVKKSKFTHRKSMLLMRRIVAVGRKERQSGLTLDINDFVAVDRKMHLEALSEILATQCVMANFDFVQYKTPPRDGWFFVDQISVFANGSFSNKLGAALERGKIIGEEINQARILSNTPGGDMTPQKLGEAAVLAGRRTGFRVKILKEQDLRKLKMGGILGVSKGSSEKPRFIIMEYLKGMRSERPVVIVGKGVTFDTGGLNLKPTDSIYEMHMDMSGGAATIHIMSSLARLKVKKNIIGLVPAVENMPSGSSYRPGDVLKTMSGKTIEVLNTDAEGRIILADALTYANRYKPKLVVDIATLTGAAIVALGYRASAFFSNSEEVGKRLCESGEIVGDLIWPLPLWEEYEDDVKGTFGDVANTGKTRYGGAINGAVFLWQFIKDIGSPSWVHLDIAPRMTSIDGEYLTKGALGASVGLLVHFIRFRN